MRILLWSYSFWPAIGGLEIFSAELLPALQERGYEFLVLTSQRFSDQPFESRYKGIPIFRFPFHDETSYTNIDKMQKIRGRILHLIRSFSPDLIHMNYAADNSNFFYLITADKFASPLLLTMHGVWHRYSSLEKRILLSADWVTCVSASTLEYGRKLIPEILPRSSVIYNALKIAPSPSVVAPSDTPLLLCIGRLSPEKGFDIAITALASLRKHFTNVRLVIAGDGPSKKELEIQADKLNLGNVVEFVGWVIPNDVPSLIRSSTLVLMPSRSEGLPLVALEASFMARPIVASRVGGLPEVVVHEETGLLVEQENPEALAKAVEHLLQHPKNAKRMGQAAHRWAKSVFGWEQHVNSYDALYHRLIEDRQKDLL